MHIYVFGQKGDKNDTVLKIALPVQQMTSNFDVYIIELQIYFKLLGSTSSNSHVFFSDRMKVSFVDKIYPQGSSSSYFH